MSTCNKTKTNTQNSHLLTSTSISSHFVQEERILHYTLRRSYEQVLLRMCVLRMCVFMYARINKSVCIMCVHCTARERESARKGEHGSEAEVYTHMYGRKSSSKTAFRLERGAHSPVTNHLHTHPYRNLSLRWCPCGYINPFTTHTTTAL